LWIRSAGFKTQCLRWEF